MKRVTAILLILILCVMLCIGCSKGGLVGKWEETALGTTFEFKRNGTLIIGDGDQTWKYYFVGTYLVFNHDDKEDYYKYQIQGSSLALTEENDMFTLHFERVQE